MDSCSLIPAFARTVRDKFRRHRPCENRGMTKIRGLPGTRPLITEGLSRNPELSLIHPEFQNITATLVPKDKGSVIKAAFINESIILVMFHFAYIMLFPFVKYVLFCIINEKLFF